MNIFGRIIRICFTPRAEWPVIAEESTSAGSLIAGYVLPLVAVGAVAGVIGGSLVGYTLPFVGTYRTPMIAAIAMGVMTLVLAVVVVFLLALIINAFAPAFGAERNLRQALKVAAYSYTPAWVLGVLNIVPILTILVLLGGLYGLYLLYLGLPRLMKCPEQKTLGYTAVVVACAIVLSVTVSLVTLAVAGAAALGSAAVDGLAALSDSASNTDASPASDSAADTTFDPDSTLGRLEAIGRQMEQSLEAAQQSGDPNAELSAVLGGLGAVLGGGSAVEPLQVDALGAYLPDALSGLPRTNFNSDRSGFGGIMVAEVEASYGDGRRNATVQIVDSGGISGLIGLASWMNIQGESENSEYIERTRREGGNIVHERISKTGGTNEYSLVLAERFMISAQGTVSAEELRAAVSGMDLAGLEAMKDGGGQ